MACSRSARMGPFCRPTAQAEQLFGYDAGALTGQPVKGLFPARVPEVGPPADVAAHRREGIAITVEAVAASWPGRGRRNPQMLVVSRRHSARRTEELLRSRELTWGWSSSRCRPFSGPPTANCASPRPLGPDWQLNMDPHEVVGMSMLECLDRDDVEATPIAAHLRALHGESLNYEMEWPAAPSRCALSRCAASPGPSPAPSASSWT